MVIRLDLSPLCPWAKQPIHRIESVDCVPGITR